MSDSSPFRGGETVYWEKTPGRWGQGEYLYADGGRALVDVWVDGGHVLEWHLVSILVKKLVK